MTLKNIVEALLFASHKPLLPKEIASALKEAGASSEEETARSFARTKEAEIAAILEQIKIEYLQADHAFQLAEQVNGWHLVSRPEFAPWIRRLFPEARPARLSGPALETLAIIAYRQPVMKADIESVRGVAVDGVLQVLLERSLVRIAGRAEVPGRPLLYETTEYFLEHFGLRSVDELPNVSELRTINLPSVRTSPTERAEEQMTLSEKSVDDSSETAKPGDPEGAERQNEPG